MLRGSVRWAVGVLPLVACVNIPEFRGADGPNGDVAVDAMPTGVGHLFVIGGFDGSIGVRSDVLVAAVHDGMVDSFTNTTALPDPARGQAVAVANGFVYLLGGCRDLPISTACAGTNTVLRAQIQPGAIDGWVKDLDLPEPRYLACAVALDGHVYVMGGESFSAGTINTIRGAEIKMQGELGPWDTTLGTILHRRFQHTCGTTAGAIFIFGGFGESPPDPEQPLNEVAVAKSLGGGALGAWLSSETFPTPRFAHGGTIVGGNAYVIGGSESLMADPVRPDLNDVRVAAIDDNGAGSWSSAAETLPDKRVNFSVVSDGLHLFAVGGETASGDPKQVLVATPSGDSTSPWTVAATLPLQIEQAAVFYIQD